MYVYYRAEYNPQGQIQFTEFDHSTDFIDGILQSLSSPYSFLIYPIYRKVYPYIMIDDHGYDGNHIPNIPNTNDRPNW